MKHRIALAALLFVLVTFHAGEESIAQIPESISTPEKLETRIGTLDFQDGLPSKETLETVYDNLVPCHA